MQQTESSYGNTLIVSWPFLKGSKVKVEPYRAGEATISGKAWETEVVEHGLYVGTSPKGDAT